jgi:phosphatidylglycerol:prolipoprotein diacylglycerol transferase
MSPEIFSVDILGFTFAPRWYGFLVMLGVVAGGWIAEKEVSRRGEKGAHVWDAMVWLIPAGVIGARLWYVVNATLGGNDYYLQNPLQIINIPAGGLHFFGGLLFGAIALFYYSRRYQLDLWLFLDAVAPVTLIGQAIARPANFINQELYGQPTTLPWGISIDAGHRLPLYSDLGLYPVATTRFHPTFAYEMIWNFLAAALLLWLARRFVERLKPGAIFSGWLILAGVGRVLIEFFRPDQPKIPGTAISYSALVSALMAVAGVVLLLARLGKIKLGSFTFPDAYRIAPELAPPIPAKAPPAAAKRRPVRRTRTTKK